MNKYLFSLLALLVGCSTTQQVHAPNNEAITGSTKDQKVAKTRAQQDQAQDQADRARILARRRQLGAVPTANPQNPGKIISVAPTPILPKSDSTVDNYANYTEGQLYAEALDAYQSANTLQFHLKARAYLSRFNNSDHRDDIQYMSGTMALNEKDYGGALVHFNRILRDHPNGIKAPAALFAKGMTYHRMNLVQEAKETMALVNKEFPGSPESFRAQAEMKLIK